MDIHHLLVQRDISGCIPLGVEANGYISDWVVPVLIFCLIHLQRITNLAYSRCEVRI